jgi:hypothetical protein
LRQFAEHHSRGSAYSLDLAAVGHHVQVGFEYLRFRPSPLQRQCRDHLPQFLRRGALARAGPRDPRIEHRG